MNAFQISIGSIALALMLGLSSENARGEDSILPSPKKEVVKATRPNIVELKRELKKLTAEHTELSKNFGKGHPKIVELSAGIAKIESALKKALKPKDLKSNDPLAKLTDKDFAKMDANELRQTTGRLVRRVVDLEAQLAKLKRMVNKLSSQSKN